MARDSAASSLVVDLGSGGISSPFFHWLVVLLRQRLAMLLQDKAGGRLVKRPLDPIQPLLLHVVGGDRKNGIREV